MSKRVGEYCLTNKFLMKKAEASWHRACVHICLKIKGQKQDLMDQCVTFYTAEGYEIQLKYLK